MYTGRAQPSVSRVRRRRRPSKFSPFHCLPPAFDPSQFISPVSVCDVCARARRIFAHVLKWMKVKMCVRVDATRGGGSRCRRQCFFYRAGDTLVDVTLPKSASVCESFLGADICNGRPRTDKGFAGLSIDLISHFSRKLSKGSKAWVVCSGLAC